MFCKNCGKELVKGARFCPACGIGLEQNVNERQQTYNYSENSVAKKEKSTDVPGRHGAITGLIFGISEIVICGICLLVVIIGGSMIIGGIASLL